ncbi:MAG: hypothetical protein ACFFFT_01630 [Candidatus Thorarchaeota archaeon]
MEKEERIETPDFSGEGHIKIDWGRQGGVILLYIIALLGYYGIIANTMMFNEYGDWISYEVMDRTILFWTYATYTENYFLPAILLFFVCFMLTYKEDIPQYGIKATIWLIPLIIAEGFVFYAIMFGISDEPIRLKFGHIEGYIDMIVIIVTGISGAISGMKVKEVIEARRHI